MKLSRHILIATLALAIATPAFAQSSSLSPAGNGPWLLAQNRGAKGKGKAKGQDRGRSFDGGWSRAPQGGPSFGEGHHHRGNAGQWLRKLQDLPPDKQQTVLDQDPKFQALSPEEQEKMRQRLQRFNNMPADRRERILRRMETIEEMSPEQRDAARALFTRFREMPEDRRRSMRGAVRGLLELPQDQREQVLNSEKFTSVFNEEERDIVRRMLDIESRREDAPPPPNE